MAAKSNLTNMALSLTLVCLVCSALLGGIYALTAAPIEQAQQAKTNSSIARVLPAFDSVPELETIEVDGASYTYYRVPGSGYAVISNSETPGLGAKCQTDTSFIDQFKGWDPAARRLAVTKDGGEVDAITASTITSRAFTAAVANAYNVYLKLRENE